MARALRIAFVVVFFGMLCVPGVTMVVRPETPNLYGVKPVPYPEFELSTKWLSAFEQWFTANLSFKRALIQLHNAFGYLVLRDLQSDAVLVGREGWLFLRQDAAWKAFREQP